MKPLSKKKGVSHSNPGGAVLKVNVPSFKFDKARDFDKMYEEAFEMGESSFDEQTRKDSKRLKLKPAGESGKIPSLLKGDEANRSGYRSGKLKPLD